MVLERNMGNHACESSNMHATTGSRPRNWLREAGEDACQIVWATQEPGNIVLRSRIDVVKP
jgi:hypothetical protein